MFLPASSPLTLEMWLQYSGSQRCSTAEWSTWVTKLFPGSDTLTPTSSLLGGKTNSIPMLQHTWHHYNYHYCCIGTRYLQYSRWKMDVLVAENIKNYMTHVKVSTLNNKVSRQNWLQIVLDNENCFRYTYTSDERFRAIHKLMSKDYLLQILPVVVRILKYFQSPHSNCIG